MHVISNCLESTRGSLKDVNPGLQEACLATVTIYKKTVKHFFFKSGLKIFLSHDYVQVITHVVTSNKPTYCQILKSIGSNPVFLV